MSKTEAQRKAISKWNKSNMTKVGCSVRKTKALEFKEACTKLGTTPNAEFRKLIDQIINMAAEESD